MTQKHTAGTHQLEEAQVERLHQILSDTYLVDGGISLPTLHVRPKDLCREISDRLRVTDIRLKDVRLNGSAASSVLADPASNREYFSDIDILFTVGFEVSKSAQHFDTLLSVVMETLKAHFPADLKQHAKNIPNAVMASMYVSKLVKVPNYHTHSTNDDVWSLISLRNDCGRNIELKFVRQMRRQCEFSMDSFQIILNETVLQAQQPAEPCKVAAMSVYGNYDEALRHLQQGIIFIEKPEEVRGGGLLKYCRLLTRGYDLPQSMSDDEVNKLESLMCTRFFIDFPNVELQYNTLVSCLRTHHFTDKDSVIRFLDHLYVAISNYTRADPHKRASSLDMVRFVQFSIEQAPELTPPNKERAKTTRHIPLMARQGSNHGHLPPCITIVDPSGAFAQEEPALTEGESSASSSAGEDGDDSAYPSPPATPEMKPTSHSRELPAAPPPPPPQETQSCDEQEENVPTLNVLPTPPSSVPASDCGSSVGDDLSSNEDEDELECDEKSDLQTGGAASDEIGRPGPTAATLEEKEVVFSRCRTVIARGDDPEGLLRDLDLSVVDVDDFGFFGNVATSGQTLLMVAAKHGRLACVTMLLDKFNANVNQSGGLGKYTALHYAAYHGHNEVVHALVQRGADVHLTTCDGETAEMAAKCKNHTWVVSYLEAWRMGKTLPALPPSKEGKSNGRGGNRSAKGKDGGRTHGTGGEKGAHKQQPRTKGQPTHARGREPKENHQQQQLHRERENVRAARDRQEPRSKVRSPGDASRRS
eukprot:comp22940_c0_seq1/m.36359 comp22940_c0_seq1/g.36359  ORF comp22940_c0_seq1/g.36359 comp22940_c0_seq1/m.36359 type:complete len:759 (-) comp22940_c0_seq1:666-2942(-)